MAPLTPEEFYKRYGRSNAIYQPNDSMPGSVPAQSLVFGYKPSEIQAALEDAEAAAANPGREQGDRLIKSVFKRAGLDGGDKVRYPRARRDERMVFEQAAAEAALNAEMERQQARDTLSNIDPNSPFAALAGGYTPEQVLSEVLGRPVSPSIAGRAVDYVKILDLSPDQAVKLAEVEARAMPRARARQERQPIPASWLEKIAATGELGPDPAAQGAIRAAMEGVIDETSPIEAQATGLDPYIRAAEAVAASSGEVYRDLGPEERAILNAQSGTGRKLSGGRRNPLDKEVKERMTDPYLVPILLAKASEEFTDRSGNPVRQPPTLRLGPGQRVYDPRQVQLALLDPRAELDPSLGYLRRVAPDQSESGAYDKAVGAPTIDPTSRLGIGAQASQEIAGAGLAAIEDPAVRRESAPMTLGQAVQDIIYRNRTPLVEIPYSQIEERPDGQLIHTRTGTPIFEIENGKRGPESATFRFGRNSEYKIEAFREFGDLIEKLTGQRAVVNERLRDPGMQRLQRAALARAMPEEALGVRGPTQGAWDASGKINPAVERALPVEGSNPTFDLMRSLARGSTLEPAPTEVPAVVRQGREADFYRELLGPQMSQMRNQAAQTMGSARPSSLMYNSDKVSPMNSPAPQVEYTADIAAKIPEAVRGNVEAGMNAPENSPSRRAAVDFLTRFMRNRAG
jgi:hypothetical protein